MGQATGPLADAIDRDLFSDGRSFNDLGWRGLWAYITKAPPLTAIHYAKSDGWDPAWDFQLETINELQELKWFFRARNFVGGADKPFPQRITRHTLTTEVQQPSVTWETVTIDDMVSPEVRALLQS